jgi:cbb3-type cytochrome oxidase maturation protein
VSIIFVLIPLGLILLGIAVWAFIWAVNHDQFEDLDRAAHSILFDDDQSDDDQSDDDQSDDDQSDDDRSDDDAAGADGAPEREPDAGPDASR